MTETSQSRGSFETIVELRGSVLRDFLDAIRDAADRGDVYSMLFTIDDGGIKVKFNNRTWSVALGEEWKG